MLNLLELAMLRSVRKQAMAIFWKKKICYFAGEEQDEPAMEASLFFSESNQYSRMPKNISCWSYNGRKEEIENCKGNEGPLTL